MSEIAKGVAIGDVILSEAPRHYCRCDHPVTRELAATVGLVPGQAMDFTAAAAAAVQTITSTLTADGGTYRIGYKGQWTTILAWNANDAAINAALDIAVALSGGTAGDIVYLGAGAADLLITASTFTFLNTLGNVEDVVIDDRLLTDGGVTMAKDYSVATTTAGELATGKEWATTTANADSILLEAVSLTDLQNADGESLRRSFLTRGPSTINADAVTCPAGTVAALVAALEALGIQCHREATMTEEGTPRA